MMTLRQHKATARYRKIEHSLTVVQYAMLHRSPFSCVYCGRKATGIDRINPKYGYIMFNCVPACMRCNARKSIYENLGFVEAVRKTIELAYRNEIPPPSEREWKAGVKWS